MSWAYFVGFKVTDVDHGLLGEIEEVDETTINTLFVIRRPDGEELLVPAQESFIINIDHKERKMEMALPDGFLDPEE